MAKKALLIGVSQYGEGLPTLLAAPMDVQAMSRVLKDPELEPFEQVRTLIDPDLGQMQTAIAELFKSCQKGDLGLLYFSGHGITDDNGKLYLCTRNTSKDNFKGNSLSASVVQDFMSDYRHQRNQVVILDCCYSGAFAEGWRAKSVDINIRPQLEVEGSVLLTSSTSTQKSFEQEGAELSLYTSYIVQGIESGAAEQDGDGYISADELHEYAKRHVKTAKPNMEPEIYGIKQGIKIKLLKARVDWKLHYRRLVEKYVYNSEISIVGKVVLEQKRNEWKLPDDVATDIENEVLEPDRMRLKNLERYQRTLEEAVRQQFPLALNTRMELKDLQEILGLRDEDISSIQNQVTTSYAERKETTKVKQQNLPDVLNSHLLIAIVSLFGLSTIALVVFAATRGNYAPTESFASPTPENIPTLQTKSQVLALQNLLIKLDFFSGSADGRLTPETRNAITRAQNFYGITPADGLPSNELIDSLNKHLSKQSEPSTSSPSPAIPPSQTKAKVLALQNLLIARGFFTGSADGRLTPETRNAITRAQNFYGITPADGLPSNELIDSLNKDPFVIKPWWW